MPDPADQIKIAIQTLEKRMGDIEKKVSEAEKKFEEAARKLKGE